MLEAGLWKRICQQRNTLMRGVTPEQMIQPTAIGALRRQWPGLRDAGGECGLGFFGQHQASQTAGRIDERRANSVPTVEPDCAPWGLGGTMHRPLAVLAMERAAAMALVSQAMVAGPLTSLLPVARWPALRLLRIAIETAARGVI
jgi:hypothetical protein